MIVLIKNVCVLKRLFVSAVGLCWFANCLADQTYQELYRNQMGTEAPAAEDLTKAQANIEAGAVYANRHIPEFAMSVWNFAPSTNPLRFEETVKPLDPAALEFLESTHTDGFIAVKRGSIIYEYYAAGMHPSTKHGVFSSGKSWTSAVWHDVMLPLAEKSLAELLPELNDTVYGRATLRQALDMRIPVDFWEDYDDPESPIVKWSAYTGYDFLDSESDAFSFMQTLDRDPDYNFGDFHYVSPNATLPGLIGVRTTGVHPYDALRGFRDKIGLEYVSGTVVNLHGQYSADGGQYFTLRDFVKLAHVMANDGVANANRVLSDAYFDDIHQADRGKQEAWARGPRAGLFPDVSQYSNFWYVVDDNIAVAVGSYGQFLVYNRRNHAGLAKFSTYPVAGDPERFAKDLAWLVSFIRAL